MIVTNSCAFCEKRPQYQDRRSGQYVCLEHARLEVVAVGQHPPGAPLTIRPAGPDDYDRVEELTLYFWDETVVDCFDRQYDVLACPAFLALEGEEVVGVASYAVEEMWDAVVLVTLSILPDCQGRDGGRALINAVRDVAEQQNLGRLIVVTSNDDLPALVLYQRYGFRISEVVPGRLARDHGGEFPGFADILVRDEIRLEYQIAVLD
jgi:GNAT superfamily N-acetyltransferase